MLIPPPHDPPADGYDGLSTSGRYHIGFLNDMDYAFDFSDASVDTNNDTLELLDKTVKYQHNFSLTCLTSHIQGTSHFMSVELVLSNVRHHAKHDIESFFWVLLFIALEFDGPRQELPYKNRIDNRSQPFSRYHDNSDLTTHANAKNSIFGSPLSFDSCKGHLRKYFQPLEPLIADLRDIIFGEAQFGYKIVQRAVGEYGPFLDALKRRCEMLADIDLAEDIPNPIELLYSLTTQKAPETPTAVGSGAFSNHPGTLASGHRSGSLNGSQSIHSTSLRRSNGSQSTHSMSLRVRPNTSSQSSSPLPNSLPGSAGSSSHMSQSSTIAVSIGKRTSDDSNSNKAFKRQRSSRNFKR